MDCTGAFLSIHPGEQFSPNPGKVDNLFVYVATCANSVFHIYVDGSININASGTRIDRCFAGGAITVQNSGYGVPTNIVIILPLGSRRKLLTPPKYFSN